jgi:hypothetical protein
VAQFRCALRPNIASLWCISPAESGIRLREALGKVILGLLNVITEEANLHTMASRSELAKYPLEVTEESRVAQYEQNLHCDSITMRDALLPVIN